MKILQQDPENTQTPGQLIILKLGRVIMIGFIVVLLSLWALTEPFYELSRWIAQGGKLKAK